MTITDLNHLELVGDTNIVGGSGFFNFSTYQNQYLNSYQYSSSRADAESQFGDAEAQAVSYNVAYINQEG